MSLSYITDTQLLFPEENRQSLLEHCRLVLQKHKDGQTRECKAFGLVSGTVSDRLITVASCIPLQRNVRSQSPYREQMDRIMAEYAIPSVTPLDHRGWVAD